MDKDFTSIDAYISSFPEAVQIKLLAIYDAIKKEVPASDEAIKYGMPAILQGGKKLVYFAATKQHYGFYPTPSGIEAFRDELVQYKHSKGAVQFPLDQPLPLDLIARITRFRAAEVSQ